MHALNTPYPHRPIESNTDKCLRTTQVVKINTTISYCIDCFSKLDNTSTADYRLITTHHVTNSNTELLTCLVCQCNLTQTRLIHVCHECVRSYLKLMKSFSRIEINTYEIEYRVNVLNDKIESLKIP